MTLLGLLIVLVVIGVALWAITTFLPMDARIKQLIVAVGVVVALLVVANAFGLFDALRIPLGHVGRR